MISSVTKPLLLAAVAVAVLPSPEQLLDYVGQVEDTFLTYAVMGALTLFASELAPIFGGVATQEGQLVLRRVITAITVGGWIGTTLLYTAGRLKWEWIRTRFKSARSTGTVALRIVRRNPARASLLVRFVFGGRFLLPMACGAAKVPLTVYLPMSLLGSLAWTLTYVLVGVLAGEAAEQLIGHLKRAEWVVTALGATALVFAVVWWWRRRVQRQARKSAWRSRMSRKKQDTSDSATPSSPSVPTDTP
jgi:membrane protein DedA with SNARE-associated domain